MCAATRSWSRVEGTSANVPPARAFHISVLYKVSWSWKSIIVAKASWLLKLWFHSGCYVYIWWGELFWISERFLEAQLRSSFCLPSSLIHFLLFILQFTETCVWSRVRQVGTARPTPRKAHIAVVHGDVMYIMGGIDSATDSPLNEVMSFHFGKWLSFTFYKVL